MNGVNLGEHADDNFFLLQLNAWEMHAYKKIPPLIQFRAVG